MNIQNNLEKKFQNQINNFYDSLAKSLDKNINNAVQNLILFEYWDKSDIEKVERQEKDNKRKSLMTNISKSKNKLEQLDRKLRDLEPGKQTKLF